jgi:hypothetical protein
MPVFQEKTVTVHEMIHQNRDDDDDDDNENAISLNKIKAELSQPAFADGIDKMSPAGERNLFALAHI